MKKLLILLFSWLITISLACSAHSEVIQVPFDQPTILSGLSVATSGDTVLLAPGTYYENFGWPSRDGITLTSTGDSSDTYIDGQGTGAVIWFLGNNTITNATRVENVTITNGSSTRGGGIKCINSSPSFSNIQVCYNTATTDEWFYGGGGMYFENSIISITNSSIRFNEMSCTGQFTGGGGIYCEESSGLISNTVIEDNFYFGENQYSGGGGLYLYYCQNITIDGVSVSHNYVQGQGMYVGGGGIWVEGDVTITDSDIANNSAFILGGHSGGGGIFLLGDSNQLLSNLFISGNSTTGWGLNSGGGGMAICSCPVIENTKIGNNSCVLDGSLNGGGGIFTGLSGSPSIHKTIISQNEANYGSAIYRSDLHNIIADFRYLTIDNNMILGSGGYSVYNEDDTQFHLTNSNFRSLESREVRNTAGAIVLDSCWWGDPSGPYHVTLNPGGTGGTITGQATIEPWLITPDTVAYPLGPENLEIVVDPPYWVGFSWDASPSPDVDGYKINFDYDESGYPYTYYLDVRNVTEIELPDVIIDTVWYFAITAYDEGGDESWFSNEVVVDLSQLEVRSSDDVLPAQYEFVSTYPNPFNPTLTARISLPDPSHLTVSVFNLLGQRVATLVDGQFQSGFQSFVFDGSNLSSGVYLIRAVVPGKMNQVKKVVLMK